MRARKAEDIIAQPAEEFSSDDFYSQDELDSQMDEDLISNEEQAFMLGYLSA